MGFTDRLGASEQQDSALAQGEMEDVDHLRLRFLPKIDQQIAAGHEIQPGERRVGEQVLHGENDHFRASPPRPCIRVPP